MPRFVILEHDHPFVHWDFLLEDGDHLRSWRLKEQPAPGRTVEAEAMVDHRLRYLDYEGPVGGGRVVLIPAASARVLAFPSRTSRKARI